MRRARKGRARGAWDGRNRSLNHCSINTTLHEMNFGPRLKAWRLSKNLTQASLAQKAGLPRPNLADIEAGRRDCTLKTLGRLAYALELRPGELLDHSPHEETALDRHQIDAIARSLFHPEQTLAPDLQAIQKALLPVVRPILMAAGLHFDPETPRQKRRRQRPSTNPIPPQALDLLIRRVHKLAASLP